MKKSEFIALWVKALESGKYKQYRSLADLNDAGIKFKTIAKIIREQVVAKNFEKA